MTGAVIALLAGVLVPAGAAVAAGPGVLSVTITPVDHASEVPQSQAGTGLHGDRVAYRVTYSCSGDVVCEDTQVQLAPPQPDPHGLAAINPFAGARETLLRYETWTAPAAGGSIGGDDATGKLVSLGDIGPGTGGSFLVVYSWRDTGTANVIWAPQLYPDGFQIANSATISSPTATQDVTVAAAPVSWQNALPGPTIRRSFTNGSSFVPNAEVSYRLAFGTGALIPAGSGRVAGFANLQAAAGYYIVEQLPAEAEFVDATWGGSYDEDSHSIIWRVGYDEAGDFVAPDATAGGGWGYHLFSGWSQGTNLGFHSNRTVTVRFPAENFDDADAEGCNFEQRVDFHADAEVTYLDSAATVKNDSIDSNIVIACWEPFGRASLLKDSSYDATSGSTRLVNVPPDVTELICPPSGRDDWNRVCTPGQPLAPFSPNSEYWQVTARNAANIPGVATIVDDDLDLDDLPVYSITTSATATIEYSYQCGTDTPVTDTVTGTSVSLTAGQIEAGCRYISASVISGSIAAGNVRPSDAGAGTQFWARFHYRVRVGAPIGATRTNSSTATMSYPDHDEIADIPLGPSSRTVGLRATPTSSTPPGITASNATPVVDPTGQPVPGSLVTFGVGGSTSAIPLDSSFTPQYAFIAPIGWEIQPDSASFPEGSVPDGVEFQYRTAEIGGVDRQIVVASWPTPQTFGRNTTLPVMSVVASPTFAVSAGTDSAFSARIGDSEHSWINTEANFGGAVQDVADLDDDGDATEWFSNADSEILVSSASGMSVLKEICRPDASAVDDCDWLADSGQAIPVPTNATDIRYRVTIRNMGNTFLSGVVGYDVLPYVGDTGTSDGSASTPRGSTFFETLVSVSDEQNVTLSFSDSTNPDRPEVYSGETTGDWGPDPVGMQAIRAEVTGSLAPGAAASFEYVAGVGVGAAADALACNSVAVASDQLEVLEPPAVCATTAEADLELELPERLPLQEGRPGVVPFTVTNNGGSASAPGTVAVQIPAGVAVTSFTPEGWVCESTSSTLPLEGPVVLDCAAEEPLPLGVPVALDIPVTGVEPAGSLCVDGVVSGLMHDPDLDNNDASACLVVAAVGGLEVGKTDGRDVVAIGDEYDYEIEVRNTLVGEALEDVVITDTLPGGLEFVSASDGGVVTGQGPDGSGGVVTWPAVGLAAAGTSSDDGDESSGAPGSVVTRTVTVRVLPSASGEVENAASAIAPDPSDSALTLEDTGTDVDGLQRVTVAKTSDAAPAGVRAGDTVRYTVTLANTGTTDYTAGDPARILDDLGEVLDDATFVPGSAEISIDGGTATPVADPVGGILSWSGALDAGTSAVLSYEVTVGDSTGDRSLLNTAFASGVAGVCADGVDEDGISCATITTGFAPVLDKRIVSLTHGDDGLWTIVYDIDVTNLSPDEDAEYDLSDALDFGAGIVVDSAAVQSAPAGVTPAAWDGSGAIATDVVLPAGAVHSYRLAVVADAGVVAGTAAALCNTGVTGGFANSAVLDVTGAAQQSARACVSPVAPEVAKTVEAPTQNPDGSWDIVYTITVTNRHTAPTDGLAYTLEDVLDVPAGVTIDDVAVAGPDGAPLDAAFDGDAETALLTGADRVPPAPSASVPSTRVYTVIVTAQTPAGTVDPAELACPPAGSGGYANAVQLRAGTSTTVLDEDSACARVDPLPTPEIVKSVRQTSVDGTTGNWTIVYDLAVSNPDPSYSTVYDLDDTLEFAEEATIVDALATSPDVTVAAPWDGRTDTVLVAGQQLAAGAEHRFVVTVVVDPANIDVESEEADCRLDTGETGTGYRNLASVVSGGATQFAAACEPATDPSVVKTTVGTAEQDPVTGLWSLEYQITVTNRSTTSAPSGIPYAIGDSFGFPAGVDVVEVEVEGADGTIDPTFDGVTQTALATGSIEAAPSETEPEVHLYLVRVTLDIAPGTTAGAACDPAQGPGGLRNETEITVGSRVSGAVACADVPAVPVPGIAKELLLQRQLAGGAWEVLYRITVANPSGAVATSYGLSDEFALGDGIQLVDAPTITAAPEGVVVEHDSWDGASSTTIAEGVLLPAAGSHLYTVRAVIDSGAVRGTDAAGDCTLEDGVETGTGMLNRATLGGGAETRQAEACATIYNPGVTKTVNGAPVQQADGSWLVSYTMSVSNPSTLALRYGLEDVLDFPAGTVVTVESAASRSGGPALVADWDGQSQLQLVAEGTELPADAVHVIDVTLRAVLADGQGSVDDGFANTATVVSGVGGALRTDADAAADLLVPELEIEKTVTADAIPRIGSTVSYEVVVRNVGEGAFTALYPAVAWDALSGVLDDAALDGAIVATPSVGTVTLSGGSASWRGALAPDASVTLSYSVVVTGDGDAVLENIAFAAQPLEPAPAPPTIEECAALDACASTETALPAVFIQKTASVDSVAPGGVVEYTVRITNTGRVDLPADDPATLSDDLSGVLDDASYRGDATVDRGDVEVTGSMLSWSGPLDAGETATIVYSVLAGAPPRGDSLLDNVATVDPTLPTLGLGGEPDPERTVTTSTPVRVMAVTGTGGPWSIASISALLLLVGLFVVMAARSRGRGRRRAV